MSPFLFLSFVLTKTYIVLASKLVVLASKLSTPCYLVQLLYKPIRESAVLLPSRNSLWLPENLSSSSYYEAVW